MPGGDAADVLVVDGDPAADLAEQGVLDAVDAGEQHHPGTGPTQPGDRLLVAGHQRVDVDLGPHQVVAARVKRDEVGFERERGVELLGEHLAEQLAADGEVGVAEVRVERAQPLRGPVRPAAHAVRRGGVVVTDTLGERVAEGN